MFYITLSLTYVAGNILGKYLLKNNTINSVLRVGYCIFNIGAILLAVAGVFHLQLIIMVISISVLTFGNGFLIPLGTAGVVGSFSTDIGYASGLLGFLQLGLAAISAVIIGIISQNSIVGLGIYLVITTFIGSLIYLKLNPVEA